MAGTFHVSYTNLDHPTKPRKPPSHQLRGEKQLPFFHVQETVQLLLNALATDTRNATETGKQCLREQPQQRVQLFTNLPHTSRNMAYPKTKDPWVCYRAPDL